MKAKHKTEARWFGWHFLPDDGRLRYEDERRPRVGKWLKAENPGSLVLCKNGMHASRRAIDAIQYAFGSVACWVELRGELLDGADKAVARERKIIARADATQLLQEAACHFAMTALQAERTAGREPDKRSWEAIRIKRRWLRGAATDDELVAAGAAAWAAGAAAWAAARAAAWAAGAAAWEAAGAAAWAAAAGEAAGEAREAQNQYLERRLRKLLKLGRKR